MGTRIAAARAKAKLTQQELAVKASTSTGVISSLERDVYGDPGIDLVTRLADSLSVPLEDLIGPNGEAAKASRRSRSKTEVA